MKLGEGDAIVGCVLTNGSNELILVSHQGQAVRFFEGADEGEVSDATVDAAAAALAEGEEITGPKEGLRAQGRFTGGVTGMRFKKKGDYVQALEVCDKEARLLVAREDGIGKRTPFEDYRMIRRGGTGVIAIDLPDDGSVAVAGALSVRDTDEVMLLTAKGQSVRTRVSEIRETGRGAKGVRLVNLEEGDKLLAIAKVIASAEVEVSGSAPPIEPTV
jgi:DNA gyrase subunit A